MLMKRLLLYFIAMLILLAVAISAGQLDTEPTLLTQYAEELGAYTETQETEALNWIRTNRAAASGVGADPALALKDYTILFYKEDSLFFWSNTKIFPSAKDLAAFKDKTGRFVARLPLGWFVLHQENAGPDRTLVLIPVRYHLDTRASVGTGPFPANGNISGAVAISDAKTDYPVQVDGKDLLWLQATGPVQAIWLQWIQLIFIGLALLLLLVLIQGGALFLNKKYGAAASIGLLGLSIASILGINRVFGLTQLFFDGLPLFSQTFQSASLLGNSTGDCLLGISLLTWGAIFFHRHIQFNAFEQLPQSRLTGIAFVFYCLAMLSLGAVGALAGHWVFYSGLPFDFDNLLNNSFITYSAIGGVLVAWIAAYQFSHRLVLAVRGFNLPRASRLMAISGAGLTAFIIAFAFSNPINPVVMAGFAILFAVLLDVYVHWEMPGFGWAVAWLLFGSLFSATTLYQSAAQKDWAQRFAYTAALAEPRDTEAAENRLSVLASALNKDIERLGLMLKPWPFKAEELDLRRYVNDALYQENYLFQHYRVQVYAFDREKAPLLIHQKRDYNWTALQNWEKGTPLPKDPNIRYGVDSEGNFRYMLLLRPNRMGDASDPANVWCFLDQEYPKPTRVYARLFYHAPYKDLGDLSRYDFAVQRKGSRMVEQGTIDLSALAAQASKGETREVETPEHGRIDAVYESADGLTLSAVGRVAGGWYKPIYLFALIFMLASVALLLLVLANSRFAFLPPEYTTALSTKGSLAKRIHYWNIATLGIAFFIIGLLTYRHFNQSARDGDQADLDFRSEAILANLKTKVNSSTLSVDSLRMSLPQTVGALASSLSMDVNLYDPAGSLLFSTQADLSGLGILPNKMNPVALRNLIAGQGGMPNTASETAAGAAYFVKYMPIQNAQHQLLGFLGVPNDLSAQKPGAEVSDFIGMLAALYVFLLLLAFTLTYFLAESITRPISAIADRIKDTDFEHENLPIVYAGDEEDEVSALINQYNAMVGKLEDSKVRIIKLQREGAWREMARQVAHDIKNPLTTMKLSMQQLERVSNNPEQAAAYLRKAITRLIEQIDSLAQIASEFSMFANLDIRQKSDMVLNEVVESVFDLFSEQKQVDLSLQLPTEQFHILGDKNHLIRVFNNLVINAIQAIPSDRKGQIKVSLAKKGGEAIVTISDNGGGIPPEIKQRVFEPNFTTKTSGSGLGLAICRKIIEAHDGTIDFDTRDNEGTDFFVVLPIILTEAGGEKAAAGLTMQ